jgi:hypothetical protein
VISFSWIDSRQTAFGVLRRRCSCVVSLWAEIIHRRDLRAGPMAIWRRVTLNVSAALLAATATLAPLDPARAAPGCSLDDLLNALENALGAVPSCAAACADGVGCAAAGAASATLAGVAADAGQNDVDQFCNALQGVNGNDASAVLGVLNEIPGLSEALSAFANPFDIAVCACSAEQGIGQITSDLGDCFQDALCDIFGAFGSPCTCTPQPPVAANCAQTNTQCGSWNIGVELPPAILAACNGQNTIGGFGNAQSPSGGVVVTTGPSGTLVTAPGSGQNAAGQCDPASFCFCPSPMVPTWTENLAAEEMYGTPENGQPYIFSCDCPKGQHAQGAVNGISVCLCDGSNAAPLPPGSVTLTSSGAFTGACPPPGCAAGQISLGGKCVTPCSNPSEGMTMDGACCNPSQMTSCGICCPPGTTPNPANGSCESFPAPK